MPNASHTELCSESSGGSAVRCRAFYAVIHDTDRDPAPRATCDPHHHGKASMPRCPAPELDTPGALRGALRQACAYVHNPAAPSVDDRMARFGTVGRFL